MSKLHVVWFKRDLRVHDHAALNAACAAAKAEGGQVALLYLFEPDYWALPQHSQRQFDFVQDCLSDLRKALKSRGADLIIRKGEAIETLSQLDRTHGLAAIHAHEETGLAWTRARNQKVETWCLRRGVAFRQYAQSGVVPGLTARAGWSERWQRHVRAPRQIAPAKINSFTNLKSEQVTWSSLGGITAPCPQRQKGGRLAAVELLNSFTAERGANYRRAMSSPVTAFEACSRLSPHLAFGTVSVREVWQAAGRAKTLYEQKGQQTYAASLNSFMARLEWRCHFTQKLEDTPQLETRALHRAYRGLRPPVTDDDPKFIAWRDGQTGFPFIDACMRALTATGWLNFRMRAMVMSFASYHLWLDWRRTGEALAALFTDFDPGIHYPQVQMQSGTTGTNTPRLYNPVKQSLDQDPDGIFIRQWVPELADLPTEVLHEPWRAPQHILLEAGITLGQTYPERLVDHIAAGRFAREQIFAPRQKESYKRVADQLQTRHGSVEAGIKFRGARPKPGGAAKPVKEAQLSLDL